MRRKPEVDYSQFRLKKINDPEYAHLKLLLGWVFYFTFYALTEAFIPYDRCTVIYSPLDDVIPFCEYFIVPYVLWYALVAGSLLYFLLFHIKSFKNLQKYIIITQVVAMTVYILFPNRQDLRPQSFPRDNIFTQIVGLLYSLDTSTNVCPSLHVAYSIAIASVWTKERDVHWTVKTAIVIFVILVCLSTVFLKQHSVVDGFAAILVCLFAEWWVFYRRR
ncbi:MAG: hypothetical protein IJY91_01325 [Oscillospiraceae bacterium]|nr:hypothetical protein [Oscillospiraceae bacterium]